MCVGRGEGSHCICYKEPICPLPRPILMTLAQCSFLSTARYGSYCHVMLIFVQACTSVDLPSEESKTKMMHMSKMFQMYATKDFTNGRDIWLAGICRYLNDAYTSLATKVHVHMQNLVECVYTCILLSPRLKKIIYEGTIIYM